MDMIAERVFEVDGKPGFAVRFGRPELEADGITWRCHYEVAGPLTRHRGSFCGVDAVQALLNVIYVLGVEAEMSEENRTGRLTWCGQREDFGFPPPEADPTRKSLG